MRISDWSSDVCSSDLYARIRTVKSDLTGPSGAPSATAVEERVRAEARIRDIETLVAGLEEAAGRLQTLSDELGGILEDLQKLPSDKMSANDSAKLAAVTMSVRQMAQEFGFSTFPPEDLTIDEDRYRQQREGYVIGFERTGSDEHRQKRA